MEEARQEITESRVSPFEIIFCKKKCVLRLYREIVLTLYIHLDCALRCSVACPVESFRDRTVIAYYYNFSSAQRFLLA